MDAAAASSRAALNDGALGDWVGRQRPQRATLDELHSMQCLVEPTLGVKAAWGFIGSSEPSRPSFMVAFNLEGGLRGDAGASSPLAPVCENEYSEGVSKEKVWC